MGKPACGRVTTDGEEHTIVVLGGDGTVNEVLNGITELSKVTMGYIPMGSSNDFARYFKMAAEPAECLTRILHPKKMVDMNVGIMSYKMVKSPDGMRSAQESDLTRLYAIRRSFLR